MKQDIFSTKQLFSPDGLRIRRNKCFSMKIERLLFVLLLVLTSALACDEDAFSIYPYSGIGETYECPSNEEFSECANCQNTCSLRDIDPGCVCAPGWACSLGYLRNSRGICVPETECDSPCNNDYGRVYNPCGGACQKSCKDIDNPNFSCPTPLNCTGLGICSCIEGLVLNEGGHCVRPESCSIVCPLSESYSECMGDLEYEDTCKDPKKRWSNSYPFCKPGCTCNSQYLRDDNRVCIHKSECNESCGGDPNAIKIFCTPCRKFTCASINDEKIPCDLVYLCDHVEGCGCKFGYAFQGDKCIPQRDCPTCSGNNEAYLCRKCELSYLNFDQKCASIDSCQDGCYCQRGFARDYFGNCIRLSEISQPPCDGDPNAYFEQCGIKCEQRTCRNKDIELSNCSKKDECYINGKCVCKEGYVKNSEGQCILPEYCECDELQQRSSLPVPISPVCGENEVFDHYPMVCTPDDVTCEMYFTGETRLCIAGQICSPRCRCIDGFVRNHRGECVTPQDCCEDPNSELVSDFNTCPGGTCAYMDFVDCDSVTLPFGCQCKKGYVKISDTNPTCVHQDTCCYY